MELLKACSKCKIEKPYNAATFRLNKNKSSGLDSWCRECAKDYRNSRRKTIAPKEWDLVAGQEEKFILAKNSTVCVICGEESAVVDHDHNTRVIRGPLCQRCNMGLGHFRDDPELLEFAAMYLRGVCACGQCDTVWGGSHDC